MTFTGLARRLQLLVDLILDRRGAFNGEKAGWDCVKDATLEFGSADRPRIRADLSSEMFDGQVLAPVLAAEPGVCDNRLGATANSTFEQAAEQILWPVRAIEPICRRVDKARADLKLALLHLGP